MRCAHVFRDWTVEGRGLITDLSIALNLAYLCLRFGIRQTLPVNH